MVVVRLGIFRDSTQVSPPEIRRIRVPEQRASRPFPIYLNNYITQYESIRIAVGKSYEKWPVVYVVQDRVLKKLTERLAIPRYVHVPTLLRICRPTYRCQVVR